MGPITYFEHEVDGSRFGEPDGTKHNVELLEGNGKFILRVRLEGTERDIDLCFTDQQAMKFSEATEDVLFRCGLKDRPRTTR